MFIKARENITTTRLQYCVCFAQSASIVKSNNRQSNIIVRRLMLRQVNVITIRILPSSKRDPFLYNVMGVYSEKLHETSVKYKMLCYVNVTFVK